MHSFVSCIFYLLLGFLVILWHWGFTSSKIRRYLEYVRSTQNAMRKTQILQNNQKKIGRLLWFEPSTPWLALNFLKVLSNSRPPPFVTTKNLNKKCQTCLLFSIFFIYFFLWQFFIITKSEKIYLAFGSSFLKTISLLLFFFSFLFSTPFFPVGNC